MKLPRRNFLHLAGATALAASSLKARAQSYPSRPVRLIVGFPAGSSSDIIARFIGEWLSERLGQPFIIDNRAGASGNIGSELALKAPPDGYTLLFAVSSNAINASLFEKLNFNFIRDIEPIAGVDRVPLVMEVHPSVPAKTLPEFIAFAKANPGKLNMASGGNGSPQHVAGELFQMMTGVRMAHVPYKGAAPALMDLLGGQVQVMFDVIVASMEFIRAAKLRPLAVTSAARLPILPDVPTLDQFVPGYEADVWHGIVAPANTAPDIVAVLNQTVNAGLADPQMRARLAGLGAAPSPMTPDEFGKSIADDTKKWAEVIKFAGVKPD